MAKLPIKPDPTIGTTAGKILDDAAPRVTGEIIQQAARLPNSKGVFNVYNRSTQALGSSIANSEKPTAAIAYIDMTQLSDLVTNLAIGEPTPLRLSQFQREFQYDRDAYADALDHRMQIGQGGAQTHSGPPPATLPTMTADSTGLSVMPTIRLRYDETDKVARVVGGENLDALKYIYDVTGPTPHGNLPIMVQWENKVMDDNFQIPNTVHFQNGAQDTMFNMPLHNGRIAQATKLDFDDPANPLPPNLLEYNPKLHSDQAKQYIAAIHSVEMGDLATDGAWSASRVNEHGARVAYENAHKSVQGQEPLYDRMDVQAEHTIEALREDVALLNMLKAQRPETYRRLMETANQGNYSTNPAYLDLADHPLMQEYLAASGVDLNEIPHIVWRADGFGERIGPNGDLAVWHGANEIGAHMGDAVTAEHVLFGKDGGKKAVEKMTQAIDNAYVQLYSDMKDAQRRVSIKMDDIERVANAAEGVAGNTEGIIPRLAEGPEPGQRPVFDNPVTNMNRRTFLASVLGGVVANNPAIKAVNSLKDLTNPESLGHLLVNASKKHSKLAEEFDDFRLARYPDDPAMSHNYDMWIDQLIQEKDIVDLSTPPHRMEVELERHISRVMDTDIDDMTEGWYRDLLERENNSVKSLREISALMEKEGISIVNGSEVGRGIRYEFKYDRPDDQLTPFQQEFKDTLESYYTNADSGVSSAHQLASDILDAEYSTLPPWLNIEKGRVVVPKEDYYKSLKKSIENGLREMENDPNVEESYKSRFNRAIIDAGNMALGRGKTEAYDGHITMEFDKKKFREHLEWILERDMPAFANAGGFKNSQWDAITDAIAEAYEMSGKKLATTYTHNSKHPLFIPDLQRFEPEAVALKIRDMPAMAGQRDVLDSIMPYGDKFDATKAERTKILTDAMEAAGFDHIAYWNQVEGPNTNVSYIFWNRKNLTQIDQETKRPKGYSDYFKYAMAPFMAYLGMDEEAEAATPTGGFIDNLVQKGESNFDYNAVYNKDYPVPKAPSRMTIGEILYHQERGMGAAGAYQIKRDPMRDFLKRNDEGITEDSLFNKNTQDAYFRHILDGGKGRKSLGAYLNGKSEDLDAAILDLAKEWAAVPIPYDIPERGLKKGQSYYAGDGTNRANLSLTAIKQALQAERKFRSN